MHRHSLLRGGMRYVDDDDDDELMRIIKRRRLRRARQSLREAEEDKEDKEDVERYQMMTEEDLEWQEVFQKQYRNMAKRPGGTNTTGRVKYKESVWGLMLCRPELKVPGSTTQKQK